MSFNTIFFNSEHPTMYTRVGMTGLLLVFIGFFAGVWIDFVATPDVNFWVGFVVCPILGLALGWLILTGSKLEGRSRIPPNPASKAIVYIGGAMMLAAFCHPGATRLAPYTLTKLSGEPYTETFLMQTHGGYKKRGCDYRMTGGPMDGMYSSHLCISAGAYSLYPDQTVSVVLSGHRGLLGMTVEHIDSIQPLNGAE